MLETFRLMCNDAIHIAIKDKPRNRFALINLAYSRLKEYGLHSNYVLSACEVAFSTYRNPKRKKTPFIARPFLKLGSDSYRLDYLLLRIPTAPRKFIYLSLDGSSRNRSLLADGSLKRGSVTITTQFVVFAVSKETRNDQVRGQMGIDVNEMNVTFSDTDGKSEQIDLSELAEVKARYEMIRGKIARRTERDKRVRNVLLQKYGDREKHRTVQMLHLLTKEIVAYAKRNCLGISLEKLKGIRKLYRKGNGQGPSYRGRMNSWSYAEIQRQIDYKAKWEGIPITYINPKGTSQNCPDCGSRVVPLQKRKLFCPEEDKTWDRDVLASKNIMMAAPLVRAARPSLCSSEGEPRKQEKAGNPPSRRMEAASISPIDEPAEPTSVR